VVHLYGMMRNRVFNHLLPVLYVADPEETKNRYGWLAALVAGVILGVGRVVYSVFQLVFTVLSKLA
jgi:hypothetical protein